ncbi:hypothetical protein BOW53_02185 [Solemya pervernicosa gill symbiont]|uniref:AFP-like domain-containing protein n=2 Tax=Solemya pervernicosa gill symbiont TaxID=642797 RepID=A0A1T2L9V0_9GAMM|nr:hypothetical protein BOW53_02185 [Solemya pervernicosa gill symbiont]
MGGRRLGDDTPCFIAAEIGINHNGDMKIAHQAIDAAVDAGADGVKFQNYVTEDFLSDKSLTYRYISQGREIVESQYEMFKRCELSSMQLAELKAHCDERGVTFFSTPTGISSLRDLLELGVSLIKNGSDFLTHLDLIREMARSEVPTVLSTGMATVAEIDDAVGAYRSAGGDALLLLHCTSSYPTPPEDINLRRVPTLSQLFGLPVGFSDHTEGTVAAAGAVALGACFVEKHFTLNKHMPGPDHRFSTDPEEFGFLVRDIRNIESALGSSIVAPTKAEMMSRHDFRLSCTASRAMRLGEIVERNSMVFHRPGSGIPPKLSEALVGLTVKRDVPAGHRFSWEDFHER